MLRTLLILFSIIFISSSALAQKYKEKYNSYDEVIETNNPNYQSYAEIDGIGV